MVGIKHIKMLETLSWKNIVHQSPKFFLVKFRSMVNSIRSIIKSSLSVVETVPAHGRWMKPTKKKSLHGYGSVRPSTCCSLLQLVFMDVHLPLHLVSYYRLDSLPWKKHHWNAFHKRYPGKVYPQKNRSGSIYRCLPRLGGCCILYIKECFFLMSTAISTIFLNNINFQNLLAQINCLNQCTSFL